MECLQLLQEASQNLALRPRDRQTWRIADDPVQQQVPGELYAYQIEASKVLRQTETPSNLLVASPTGSGKTMVIQECAVIAHERGQRLFVAEPLIALVEQVYAKLKAVFGSKSVDMRTGPSVKEASDEAIVTVCTFEVLATMCSAGADALSGSARVVIDEFHFLAGDRGPVLQEILDWCRTDQVSVVALSGTLVNEKQVAEFISGINSFPTVIVGACRRPVPLSFFYYDGSATTVPFSRLGTHTWPAPSSADIKSLGGLRTRQDVLRLIRALISCDSLPVLIVAFSCRKLDEWAEDAASSGSYLNSRSQRSTITGAFRTLLRTIPDEDKVLFYRLERLAMQGIGLHHSHLPVQYLELVSCLSERRCMPIVFSTSTLSAGINLPVRTVCICAGKVPQKVGAELCHVPIDPLLFHQLAGRAGRPGYEDHGYVVVTGLGWNGYEAARMLLERPLPPVKPAEAAYTSGDVLRAARTSRWLPLDRLVFESSEAACRVEKSQRSHQISINALSLLPNAEARTRSLQAMHLVSVVLNAPDVLHHVCGATPTTAGESQFLGQRQERGCFTVSAEPSSRPLALNHRKAKRPTAVHLSAFHEARSLKSAKEELIALWLLMSPEEHLAMAVLINAKEDRESLGAIADVAEYKFVEDALKSTGFMELSGALTMLGKAAAVIRSCREPSFVVLLLTRFTEELSAIQYVALASLLLDAGFKDSPKESAYTGQLPMELEKAARDRDGGSSATFNNAAVLWSSGSSLSEIQESAGLSCGQTARHVVRVNDLLCEISSSRDLMGMAPDQELCKASFSMVRGLPFSRRGAGRLGIPVTEEEA
jgi:hypothetical protein